MRTYVLLAASVSILALGGCSSLWDSADTPAKKAAATPTPASAPAPAPISASDKEAREMAALMGEEKISDVYVEPKDVPPPPVADMDPSENPAPRADAAPAPAGAPKDCPGVEVLPDTKSITYFDDPMGKPTGALVARAQLIDIKGGCDYTANSVVVDIDMVMQGKITDKGRYDGRRDLEAFMTFPYFVAIMAPDGKMIDKKIMATAMRFKPNIDDLDHAEKITQTIPLDNMALGPQYTITLGFQLNRAQLDYNRGGNKSGAESMEGKKATPDDAVKADQKKPAK
ncbi:MAG: hypothetical protein EBQ96_03755 [Proteobacteria bacterium]|nr:hypothetical protein [Pseudomonadota bacterium]